MRSKILLLSQEGQARVADMLASRPGFEIRIESVGTIHQAREILAVESFDAILFDTGLAGSGLQEDIQAIVSACGPAPLILLTDKEDEDIGAAAVHAGAHDYLVKRRINPDALRRIIRYAIERTQFQRKYDRLTRLNSERRRMEEALRESQDRIRAITESLFEGVLVTDIDGFVAFSNHSADSLLGDERTPRIAGRFVDSIFSLRADQRLLLFSEGPFSKVVETGQSWRDDDAVFQLRNGRTLLVAYACSALVEEGIRKGIIISFRDIQSLKRAQQESLQASKLASVGQLAAGIAHEINTPIQYIGDNLRFLGDSLDTLLEVNRRYRDFIDLHCGEADAQAREALATFETESDLSYLREEMPPAVSQSLDGVGQVARIVLAMKEFSHPGEREKVAVDLNRAIENTLAVSRNEWKHVAEVRLDLAEDLPQVACLPGEMNQVLLNLIVNAAHAIQARQSAEKGLINLATRRHGRFVDIIVGDDGVGMSESIKERIFDPFFTTKAVGKGTGQGLAICRDVVVTKHSGRISVDTEEGKGTVFTICLPIDGKAAQAAGRK
ncbi:hybrid sensor histidine kinase/response regulator [Telmatospirillum siberiense]|uniref:histidine kinase n=1 Tax=Telmatospirillum siberiense TaxID=382514 RepID=A0A2N3PYP0_9PROT|nr:ATP-binding protein [Telmatospirillum siberiense]PKU25530.1 histidine kinase [Telmatospirillum siberiense]